LLKSVSTVVKKYLELIKIKVGLSGYPWTEFSVTCDGVNFELDFECDSVTI
jgi:hypothetical protein